MVYLAFGSISSVELETVSTKARKFDIRAETRDSFAICEIKGYLLVLPIA